MFRLTYGIRRRVVLFFSMVLWVLLVTNGVMAQSAEWTFLVYIEGDNNLEGDALADIQEMEIIGSSDAVNIVVQVDRAEDYSAGDGDWTDARRYVVEQNAGVTVYDIINLKFGDPDTLRLGTTHVEELGETNNGDPQTLIDFVMWGVENYPADKYGLVFWNHGGTWIGGFGGDESTPDHDGMNMPEMDEALSIITTQMGEKFEFIGFDTCLMGGYEVFAMLSEYANYAAGSEELEPGFGWYYAPVVEALVNDPSIDGGSLAQVVVDGYMHFYDGIFPEFEGTTWYEISGQTYGQTAVDLSHMDSLDSAMSEFIAVAIANMDSTLVSAIGDARNNAQMFMLSQADGVDTYGSTDLMHFMELLQRFSTNDEVNTAAQGVIDALNNLVIDHQATAMPGARGVSIYFPANQRFYTSDGYNVRYANEVPYMAEWASFLEAFYGLAVSEAVDNKNSITISDVVQSGDTVSTLHPPTLIIDTVGTDIVELSFSAILELEDGTQYMIDNTSLTSATITEDGEEITNIPDGAASTQFTWGVDMPVVTDGENVIDTVLLETGDDETVVVTGDYTFLNGDSVGAYIIFNIETQLAASVWGFNESENGGQPFEITPRDGETFIPSWRYFDENGDVQLQSTGVELVFGDEPFRYDFYPAESGTYYLYVFMTDVAGNVYFDETQLIVDNDDVDTTYRGVADVNFGYNAIYPFDWAGALDIEDAEGNTRTEYSDNEGRVTVFFGFYEASSLEDMDVVIEDYIATYATEIEDPTAITIDGYDGYEIIYYTLTEDQQEIYGALAYTVVPENEIGYLIDYTVFDEPTDADAVYYSDLINNITFFTPYVSEELITDTGDSGVVVPADAGSIVNLLAEYGITAQEFDDFFADQGYNVADLQAEIDAGIYTIEQFEIDFLADEE